MRAWPILSVLCVLAMLSAASAAPAGPIGYWRVADGSATVRIHHCGRALCGYIARTASAPGKDVNNPDPRKRNRSVLGMEVLINMLRKGPNLWAGKTYNADDGQIYAATISMAGPNKLKIRGCIPGSSVCGSETWSRVR